MNGNQHCTAMLIITDLRTYIKNLLGFESAEWEKFKNGEHKTFDLCTKLNSQIVKQCMYLLGGLAFFRERI